MLIDILCDQKDCVYFDDYNCCLSGIVEIDLEHHKCLSKEVKGEYGITTFYSTDREKVRDFIASKKPVQFIAKGKPSYEYGTITNKKKS